MAAAATATPLLACGRSHGAPYGRTPASLAQCALRHRFPGSWAPWRARRGPTVIALLIVAGLIVLNAFFALSEMALVTSRKIRLKQMSETSRGARKALALAEQPDNLLSTVQVGITLIGVLTGLVGGDAIGLVITGWLQDVLPAAGEYARPIGIGTAVGLITAAPVIFGELIPKCLALNNAAGIASVTAIPPDTPARAANPGASPE